MPVLPVFGGVYLGHWLGWYDGRYCKHLDDETVNLRRKSQIYRQEEITEEIEVILLNSEIN